MVRSIFAVIVGFIIWSLLWVGTDEVIRMMSPGWYGAHQLAAEKAIFNQTGFVPDTVIMLITLVRSIIISLAAGFIASVIALGDGRSFTALGILLLLTGAIVQFYVWNIYPVWYHLLFLALLIPAVIAGGKIKQKV